MLDTFNSREQDTFNNKEQDITFNKKEQDTFNERSQDTAFNQKEQDTCKSREQDTTLHKREDTSFNPKEQDTSSHKSETDTCYLNRQSRHLFMIPEAEAMHPNSTSSIPAQLEGWSSDHQEQGDDSWAEEQEGSSSSSRTGQETSCPVLWQRTIEMRTDNNLPDSSFAISPGSVQISPIPFPSSGLINGDDAKLGSLSDDCDHVYGDRDEPDLSEEGDGEDGDDGDNSSGSYITLSDSDTLVSQDDSDEDDDHENDRTLGN